MNKNSKDNALPIVSQKNCIDKTAFNWDFQAVTKMTMTMTIDDDDDSDCILFRKLLF